MALSTRNTVVLAKVESTEGVDASPTASADAILANVADVAPQPDIVESQEFSGSLDLGEPIIGGTPMQITIQVYAKGSGLAGTAPEVDPLLKGCGLDSTIVTSKSVLYLPISTGIPSLTIYVYRDGLLWKFTGCRGTAQLTITTRQLAIWDFTFTGRFASKEDASVPSATFDTARPPTWINGRFTVEITDSAAGGEAIGDATLVVDNAIPATVPQTGHIRLRDVSTGTIYRLRYASWATSTFTLAHTSDLTEAGTTTTAIVATGLFANAKIGDLIVNTTQSNQVTYITDITDDDNATVFPAVTGQTTGDSIELNGVPVVTVTADEVYMPLPAAVQQFSVNLNNTVALPDNPNDTEGFDAPVVTARDIQGSMNPLETLVATRAIFTDFRAGTKRELEAILGTVAGNIMTVNVPAAKYRGETQGDRDALLIVDVPFSAVSVDDGVAVEFT